MPLFLIEVRVTSGEGENVREGNGKSGFVLDKGDQKVAIKYK
jgi:hypothetical protein